MKYKKKPTIIEAIQWDGSNINEVIDFTKDKSNIVVERHTYTQASARVIIHTLEGDMEASIGDYIIRGVKGEYYPCKPDVFDMTYDPVE